MPFSADNLDLSNHVSSGTFMKQHQKRVAENTGNPLQLELI
jgi:hypothetical protein